MTTLVRGVLVCVVAITITMFAIPWVRADWFCDFEDRVIPPSVNLIGFDKAGMVNDTLEADAEDGFLRLRDSRGIPPASGGTLEGDCFDPEVFSGDVRVSAKINLDGGSNDRLGVFARHAASPALGGYSAWLNLSYSTGNPGKIVVAKVSPTGGLFYSTSPGKISNLTRSYLLELSVMDNTTTGYPTVTGRLYDDEGGPLLLEATLSDLNLGGTPPWQSGYAGAAASTASTTDSLYATYDNIRAVSIPTILTWSGSVDGTWDVDTTANFAGRASGKSHNGDQVVFGDTGNNAKITIAEGGVAPGSVVFSNTVAKDYELSGGAIQDEARLSVSGGGRVTPDSDNAYTGGTVVSLGTLTVASPGALPAGGSLTVGAGGTVVLQSGLTVGGASASAVPEPSTIPLLGIGALVLLARARQHQRRVSEPSLRSSLLNQPPPLRNGALYS